MQTLISDVVSRHESVRGCWLDKEEELKQQLEREGREKKGLTCELHSLRAEFGALKVDFETQMKVNNEQSTRVSRVSSFLMFFFSFFPKLHYKTTY